MNDITWGEPEVVNVHVWIVVSSLRSPYTNEVVTHSKNVNDNHGSQQWSCIQTVSKIDCKASSILAVDYLEFIAWPYTANSLCLASYKILQYTTKVSTPSLYAGGVVAVNYCCFSSASCQGCVGSSQSLQSMASPQPIHRLSQSREGSCLDLSQFVLQSMFMTTWFHSQSVASSSDFFPQFPD